ncbi:MAG: DMT family transporter [Lachnospirales bacterium]
MEKKRAIGLMLLAAVCFSLMGFFVKALPEIPSMEKAMYRNLISLIIAFIIIVRENKEKLKKEKINAFKEILRPKNPVYLFCRVLCGTLGIIFSYYAIDRLILSDATVLTKTSPFFTIIFSFVFIREKISKEQLVGLFIAFIGVLFVVKPVFNVDIMPYLIALIGALFAGLAYTFLRILGNKGENGSLVVLGFSFFSTVFLFPFVMTMYVPLDAYSTFIVILIALSATGGQFCITNAYKLAPAKEISIYDYLQVVFTAVLSIVFFMQWPDIFSFVGYGVIIGASLWMFKYNTKK